MSIIIEIAKRRIVCHSLQHCTPVILWRKIIPKNI